MPVNIRPLHDRVLVKRLESDEEQVRGGIIIPDNAKEKPQEAEVVAVGPGKIQDSGERQAMDVKAGDRILVGRYSGSDIKIDDKARVEDAMHATKAAVEDGIVPGGGVAFLRCIEAVRALKGETHDIDVGIKIAYGALEEPTRQIVANSGEEGSIIVKELQGANGNTGYNAATGKTEDLVKAGVIDPAKVAKSALLNAASIAGLMLTTEALVSEIKEKEGGNGGGGMGEGMGGMY